MRRILWVAVAATTVLLACGGGDSPSGAGGTIQATSTTGAGGEGIGGGDGGLGGNGKLCAAGKLCLQVAPVVAQSTLPKGRLVVAWYSIDPANTTAPLIAYDMPFESTTTRIDIAYTDLAPVTDALMLCTRSCMSPATCPCTGTDPALGFAVVGLGEDQNGDGKLTWAELEATRYGAGQMAVVYSAKAFHPSPAGVASVLPEGINVGTHAYRLIPGGTGPDQLGIAFDGTVFNLAVCDGEASCKVPTPKLK
jgi:hypothetical protein